MAERPVKRNPLYSKGFNYELAHVGGGNNSVDRNDDYIDKQNKIITDKNTRVPASYRSPYDDIYQMPYGIEPSPIYKNTNYGYGSGSERNENMDKIIQQDRERYDFMTDFLYRNGLIDRDNIVKYDTYYINIDSSTRQTQPSVTTDNPINLTTDPLQMIEFSSDGINVTTQLQIYQPNHNFNVSDNIILSGVQQFSIILRTYDDSGNSPFTFTTGSQYLQIVFPNATQIMQNVYNGTYNGFPWTSTDSQDLFINISGFNGSSSTNPYIGNIPINTLNTIQQVYFTTPTQAFDVNTIYVLLDNIFDTGNISQSTYIFPSSYNITITYMYTAGVPNNLLNANYPINASELQGYLTIAAVQPDYYYININHRMGSITPFGGIDIYVALVTSINQGYPNPNSYILQLDQSFLQVVYSTLVCSEFPNTQKVVRNSPASRKNNVFYWENQDDGSNIYSVTIQPGNYDVDSIVSALTTAIFAVPRVNYSSTGTKYTNANFMQININTQTDVVTFNSYKQAFLQQPFVNVTPPIPATPSLSDPNSIIVQVFQTGHNLSVGEQILISGAIPHLGIPETLLNGTQTVYQVIDANNYTLQFQNFNLYTTRNNTLGGNAVMVLAPSVFRIRCDFADSICQLLGFRDVGLSTSITNFETSVTNNEAYANELPVDTFGNAKNFSNLSIDLAGDDYMNMICPELAVDINLIGNGISDLYSKIQLSAIPSKVMFNTFIYMPHIYFTPISQLSQLTLSFVAPDGTPFDFDGINHSFTIKLVTFSEHPKGTYLDTTTGKSA